MKFHPDTRQILKAATLLALARGAAQVEVEHLLECEPESPGRAAARDIAFSPQFLEILKSAAELAALRSSLIIRPIHLELALLTTLSRTPLWGVAKPTDPVLALFDDYLLARLKALKVNLELLGKSLSGLTLRQCRPAADFLQTLAGQRYLQLVKGHTSHALARPVFLLLAYLLSGGPAALPLSQAGVTEELLLKLLTEEAARPLVDFAAVLGPGWQRLSGEARYTFQVAWRYRAAPLLQGEDLLRALLMTANDIPEPSALARLLQPLVGELGPVPPPLPEIPVADLSPEVYRVFAGALQEAGPEQAVGNAHLLVALALGQLPMLVRHQLTAEVIRQAL
ncbi:MAG: hypothetical protein U0931_22015 [Vulcanimicrobiota bacterium]